MPYRKFRIAWSVAWGVLAVLLVVLWVRSFWSLDFFSRINNERFQTTIGSQSGAIYFAHGNAGIAYKGSGNSSEPHDWKLVSREPFKLDSTFSWEHNTISLNVVLPHWCGAIVIAMIGGGIWLPFRFSLRTLLIATTLVAVMLGLIVWLR